MVRPFLHVLPPSLAPSYCFIKRPFQFEFNKPSPCKPRTSSQHCNPRCFIAQALLLSGWKARSHLLAQPPLPRAAGCRCFLLPQARQITPSPNAGLPTPPRPAHPALGCPKWRLPEGRPRAAAGPLAASPRGPRGLALMSVAGDR